MNQFREMRKEAVQNLIDIPHCKPCYRIRFVEIGIEEDHVHMLVQGIHPDPTGKLLKIIKSITAREIFKQYPYIRKEILWGREPLEVLCQHGGNVRKLRYD